jgi:hypothetical protein
MSGSDGAARIGRDSRLPPIFRAPVVAATGAEVNGWNRYSYGRVRRPPRPWPLFAASPLTPFLNVSGLVRDGLKNIVLLSRFFSYFQLKIPFPNFVYCRVNQQFEQE